MGNDMGKDKDMKLSKLQEIMKAYHDTLKAWKNKKQEASNKLKIIEKESEEWKELDRIEKAYEELKIKKRLENFNKIERLKDDVKKIYEKLTGSDYPGKHEIFEDVLKETIMMLENRNGSPVEAPDYDYERTKLKSIQSTYETEDNKLPFEDFKNQDKNQIKN